MQGVLFYFFRRVRGGGELRFGKERTFECKGKNGVGLPPQDSAGKKGEFMRMTTQKLEGRETDGAGAARGLSGEKNDFVRVGKARKI